jgi:hypothetical protein
MNPLDYESSVLPDTHLFMLADGYKVQSEL